MKFGEVKVKEEFKVGEYNYIRIPKFYMDDPQLNYWEDGKIEVNCVCTDGDMEFFLDDDEVEVLDKCVNCKFYKNQCMSTMKYKIYSKDAGRRDQDVYIEQDPEKFWCNGGERK